MEAVICSSCNQKIEEGEYVNLDPKFFHIDHFTCKACNQTLGGKTYFEKENKFYCEDDYQSLFGVKCDKCLKPIKEQYICILGKNYHHDCFCCASCNNHFKDEQYFNFEGNPYCAECSKKKAHTCEGCSKPILEKLYSALDKYWHFECFKCVQCGENFKEGFLAINGKAYHQKCFKLACIICGKNCTEEYYQVENNQACHAECIEKYKENRKKVVETIAKAEKKLEQENKPVAEQPKKPTEEPKKPAEEPKKPAEELKKPVEELKKPVEEPKKPFEEKKSEPKKPDPVPVKSEPIKQEEKKAIEKPQEKPKQQEPILVKPTTESQLQAGAIGKSVKDSFPVFPYEKLISLPYPPGVDSQKREEYLSDAEFQATFKMTKEAFRAMPKWKQNEAKKKTKLF